MLRMGIDFGGTKTEGIVLDDAGNELFRERRATPTGAGYFAILSNIAALVADLERAAGASCRVGIGTPGALSVHTGRLKNSNTTCLNGQPILEDLQRLLDRPVRLANDANCFALSEARDGAGYGADVVFGVILGTGVGGGVVVHGRFVQGAQHVAGEWGHNVLEADGPPCYCGRRGCVETFLSGPGLARDYAPEGTAVAAAEIIARATAGETNARAALDRYLERFARTLSVIVNILDPDVIVLGGGMSNFNALYTAGRERLQRYVFAAHGANAAADTVSVATHDELCTRLLRHVHGDSSGVRGAAHLWDPDDR
jgi:fructokinase